MKTRIKNIKTGEIADAFSIDASPDGKLFTAVIFNGKSWQRITLQEWKSEKPEWIPTSN